MNKIPTISIVIPTINEERNIGRCLESIFSQSYPKNRLEVIIVDDLSTDKTLEIAKNYPVKILTSGKKHGEISKIIGFNKARGDYVMYLDADTELKGKAWFQKMILPLIEDPKIVASFTWEGCRPSDSPMERYLSFDQLQRDPVYQFFSPGVQDVISEKRQGYDLCVYKHDKIPPAGRCLYRSKQLLEAIKSESIFMELDVLMIFILKGLNKFAYVPETGIYHHHAPNLSELLRKRRYNMTKVYFLHAHKRLYTWFDLTKKKDVLKIIIWVIYANLIIPSVFVGIYKSIRHNDIAGMYEPIVTLLVTDLLIIDFLFHRSGRAMLLKVFGQ